jgi:hypothetical protein
VSSPAELFGKITQFASTYHQLLGVVPAVLLILAWIAPRVGDGVFAPMEALGSRLAKKKRAAILSVTAAAFALRLSFLRLIPVPVPETHDELHSGPDDENEGEVEQALLLRKITTLDAKLAVARAGTIPYLFERPEVDFLGKNDRYIAHESMRRSMPGLHRFIEFRSGHMKYYDHSIGRQAPNGELAEAFD